MWKKIIALSMAATLLCSSFIEPAVYASEETEDKVELNINNDEAVNISGFQYEVKEDDKTIIITEYIGSEEKVIIPEKIDGIEVTAIGNSAFKEKDIKEINMPFIKEIGEEAFLDCDLLESVELFQGVIIGTDAFKGTNINTVTINYKEESIADKTLDDFNKILEKMVGVDCGKVTGRYVRNNEYTRNLDDTIGPVITLNGESLIKLEVGAEYKELGATAYDEMEKVDIPVKVEGAVDTSKTGEYILVYTAMDSSRNISKITRKVNVADTKAPVIELNGKSEVTIEAGQKYEELGAIGRDEEDGEIKATVAGEVNTNKPGVYILTYTVTDSSGNSATATRKVKVIDTTAPEIILKGKEEVTVEAGSKYEELGAEAKDIVDGKVEVKISGEVDTKKVGEYTITYSAKDSSGNKAIAIRKVKVADTTRPIIIFNGEKEITIEAKSKYVEPGAIGKDTFDGKVEVSISGVVDTGKVGEYIISYRTSDKAGNKASAIRKVKVVDTKAPVITLNGESKITLEQGDKYEELGATANDEVDGQVEVKITGNVDVDKAGEYKITYTATDNSKNTSTVTRSIEVKEKKVVEDNKDIENNETIDSSKESNKFIWFGVIGGIVVVIGAALAIVYYKKK